MGEWRRLHNVEHHILYPSPNIVQVIKSRRLSWAGHVARIEKLGVISKCQQMNLQEDLGVHERTILEWTLKKWYQYEEFG